MMNVIISNPCTKAGTEGAEDSVAKFNSLVRARD